VVPAPKPKGLGKPNKEKMMTTSLQEAAKHFVEAHKPKCIDIDHIEDGYGSVVGYLQCESQPHGDLGGRIITVADWESRKGYNEDIFWYEDVWQISYYRLPFADRVTREDHTPEIEFDPHYDFTIDKAIELKNSGYHDITVDEVKEGVITESIDLEGYFS